MHLSSLDKMRDFRSRYLEQQTGQPLRILDLGSADIGGTYRDLFAEEMWDYQGIDIANSPNVDLVLSDPYSWTEIDSSSVDVFVSGQTFEHIEYFWCTMQEIARILKSGGLCCIIAPSGGPEHRYPVDCWRFYPDGFKALARYAGLEVLQAYTDWTPETYPDGSAEWKDSVLVARKPEKRKATESGGHVYQTDIAVDEDTALSRIAGKIRHGSTVLELGPATGYFTRLLKETLGCTVDCVEISEAMAEETRPYCRKMVVADLERVDFPTHFEAGGYDYIIAADVLEHLHRPDKVLAALKALLKEEGRCLVSVPNIAHASVLGCLIRGRFDYTDEGLLDATHLHFFTRSSIIDLADSCGFGVESLECVAKTPDQTEIGDSLVGLPTDVEKFLLARPDALSYQFVLALNPAGTGLGQNHVQPDPPSPPDLRRLFIAGLMEQIRETEAKLSEARQYVHTREEDNARLQEKCARVREEFESFKQDYAEYKSHMSALIKARDTQIENLRNGLAQAQELAFSRLDELTAIKSSRAYKAATLFRKK